jgi:hypothetical protein
VIVNLVDRPGGEPETSWIIALDSLAVPVEEVVRELEALTWLAGEEYPAMSIMDSRQGVHNWGASASFAEFVLSIASGGLAGLSATAVDAAARDLFRKFRERADGDDWGNVITEEQAVQVAKSRLAMQYGVAPEELSVWKAETDSVTQAHTFHFRHPDGRTFGAIVGIIKDSPTCMRIWREAASNGS